MSSTRSNPGTHPSWPPARRSLAAGAAAVAVAVMVLAGCGSENIVKDGAQSKDSGVPTLSVPTTLASAAGKACKPLTDLPKAKGKPTSVIMPTGKPPTTLQKSDIKVGTGPAAKLDDLITVNYIGISCSTGKQFQSSWDSGTPFAASLTKDQLIPGWVQGIPGMKAGGQRELVIPPALAYGDAGSAGSGGEPGIAPGETLIFLIQMEKLGGPAPATTVPGATTAPASATTVPATTAPTGSTTTVAETTTTG